MKRGGKREAPLDKAPPNAATDPITTDKLPWRGRSASASKLGSTPGDQTNGAGSCGRGARVQRSLALVGG
jgi:hypothetical protein